MRSQLLLQTRAALRGSKRCRNATLYSGLRWLSTETRQFSTPLAKQLHEAITATGPIPLASFMRMCLTSDVGGYYTSKQEGRDQFGKRGDFITSPEISQTFGELVGVWFVTEWLSQGRAKEIKGLNLIEMGPGRGTLMADILRTLTIFKPLVRRVEAVYMVEASPALRDAQKELLCGKNKMNEIDIGYKCISQYANIPIIWTENIKDVPSDPSKTPFIVAHEFFDALPIHAFQSVPPNPNATEPNTIQTPTGTHQLSPSAKSSIAKTPQWREMVVSPAPPDSTHTTLVPEFQLTLSHASTPHSLYLPEISPRYKALKNTPGSLIEISPESHTIVSEFATRIGGSPQNPRPKPSGAALILDYGPSDTIPTNSLRGIKAHKAVSPLSEPGLVDLSADVDFMALAEAAMNASEGVEVHGPLQQGDWLEMMGIRKRGEALVEGLMVEEDRKRIEGGWKRLIDRGVDGMGKVYKVMAILPENGGKRRPVGFGGDAEEVEG
ncbi:hypothetical protein CJF30_00003333 [Rutstroemia sp. NJR-2017a BBW]|nr:hypothetical protein CJF30_00003333 [Rutstroemia sp. NJR-2017a BBW]